MRLWSHGGSQTTLTLAPLTPGTLATAFSTICGSSAADGQFGVDGSVAGGGGTGTGSVSGPTSTVTYYFADGKPGAFTPSEEPADYRVLTAFALKMTGKKPVLVGVSEGAGKYMGGFSVVSAMVAACLRS